MKVRYLAIALTLLTAFSSDSRGQSKQSPPSERELTEPHEQKGTADNKEPDQKKADPPQIIVNVMPAPKTDHEAEDERQEHKEKADLDRRLVYLTGDLALFTAGLFAATAALVIATIALAYYAFKQSRDMKASLALTKIAAVAAENAANTAKESMVSTQRAFVFMQKFNAGFIFEAGQVHHIVFKPDWENSGVTPARNVRTWTGVVFTENSQTIDNIEITEAFKISVAPSTMGPKSTVPGTGVQVQIGDAMTAWRKERRLFLWGFIEYRDIFEVEKPRHTQISAEVVFNERPNAVTPVNFSENTLDFRVIGTRYNSAE